MEEMLNVTNSQGIPFNVRLVFPGECYGCNDCLTNDSGKTLIEFYDSRFIEGFGPRGQFVSNYFLSDIFKMHSGLILDGGIPDWRLTPHNMVTIDDWIINIALRSMKM